jgi:endonuclease YncB( thermonuclease family)/beta-lactam-binding protein with PASTA domain
MIKKLLLTVMLLLSITLLIGCNNTQTPTEITLPNLTGMNRDQVISALSGKGLQISFDDVIDNSRPEGIFSHYSGSFAAGQTVEKNTAITVFFVKHMAGIQLPNLAGKTVSEMENILVDMDLFYTFVEVETNDVEEGTFFRYGSNYQVGQYVPDWTEIVIEFATEPYNRQFIISKYVEGSNNNKAIELANRSQEAVDLSEYTLVIFENGSMTPTVEISLSGTLAPNQVFVITHTLADAPLLAKANMTTSDFTFDGNDTIGLRFKNGRMVDQLGTIGFAFFYLRNETFVRRAHITNNSTTFNALDWDIYAQDNYAMLGSHPTAFPTSFTFDPANLAISFNLPGGMVQVTYDYANDGDTSTFYSLDPEIAHFLGGRRVRFVGVDTPEVSGQPDAPQPYALQAMEYLQTLLNNATTIYLMHDPASGNTETYGRTLALVWADGVLVNVEIVRMGYSAAPYNDEQARLVFNGVSLNRWFQRAEEEAKAARRGIWS